MDLVVYGFINSATLVLISVGFALVYGVSRIPNFSHGAIYVLSGALCWSFMSRLAMGYIASIVISLIIVALVGALIYQLVLMRIRGLPFSEIIASFAIGMAILEALRLAGFSWSQSALPTYVKGTINILGVPVDWQRLILVGAAMALAAALWLFTNFTKIGLGLSGIAQDEDAALLLGIDSDLAATIAMAIGAASVGIASIVILPLSSIKVEQGYEILIYALSVCVIGGLGSWLGAVFASFILGYSQVLAARFIGPQFQIVVALFAIILILLLKPSGLLGEQKALEERV
ncbi:MAG: branched-chain amino acid ABC transporter permease [Pseudomonadota bacterium]